MLLSPSVAFVRTILLEEMAKGLDSASRLAADAALQRLRANLAAFGVRSGLSTDAGAWFKRCVWGAAGP
jgi:hypothetical protein